MSDYKAMYHALSNSISTTIESLKAVQCNMENAYIESAEASQHIVSYSHMEDASIESAEPSHHGVSGSHAGKTMPAE